MILPFHLRRSIGVLIATGALLTLFVAITPWKSWVEAQVKSSLAAAGLGPVQLNLSTMGPRHLTVKDLALGKGDGFFIQTLAFDYQWGDLLRGRLHSLAASGLNLDILKDGAAWRVAGFSPAPVAGAPKPPFAIPVTAADIDQIPVQTADVKDSRMHIMMAPVQGDVPFQVHWQKAPAATITFDSPGLQIKGAGADIKTGPLHAQATLDTEQKRWEGLWSLNAVDLNVGADIPPFNGQGTLSAQADQTVIQGRFSAAAPASTIDFSLHIGGAPDAGYLTIKKLLVPWNEGTVTAHNIKIPLNNKSAVAMTFQIDNLSADALFQQLSDKRAHATGRISGTIPLSAGPNGALLFHDGLLQAAGPGLLQLSPDMIPGDNEQVAMLREILKDFHYTALSIHLGNGKNGRMMVKLALQGNNPKVQGGRAVKVHVTLNGDVLDYVQQNLLWLTDPQKILEQGTHENP